MMNAGVYIPAALIKRIRRRIFATHTHFFNSYVESTGRVITHKRSIELTHNDPAYQTFRRNQTSFAESFGRESLSRFVLITAAVPHSILTFHEK